MPRSRDTSPPHSNRAGRGVLHALLRRFGGWARWLGLRFLALMFLLVLLFSLINPPTSWTIATETRKYPGTPHQWTAIGNIAPVMVRSVVAAEDANFCTHWGFDMAEIRKVIAEGSSRGASTLSQQTAKNLFLWQGRSWPRKLLETVYTPMIEALWSKRRIVEVYLNLAEFGPGVFGIAAAAKHHYGTTPDKLSAGQAAALASILPAPKTRKPQTGSRRSRAIADGAATIARDGRDACLRLPR
ncbi:monofunctional biosynthetic peptidoglycan transglycosylase [Paracoccus halophilus]|uniref:Biosynthetic peptidoglycan transglycosylase n=1 Tax=Paracoccus halophilus TaxID=376733 RepID=A0A099F5S3_9RHOB|nr:monofunctional biosynthetic peptidoglycan transglycosylase [Paracoccus halophilus]KGJ05551.1 peptidoglycan transglycosylase [Paracoccus halophilus]SFA46974.1 monofunctional biosynthetic peptidoglycan transglycosylase [Paracoccus halophilus]